MLVVSARTVQALIKILEVLYECSELCTVKSNENYLHVEVTDAFGASKNTCKIPVHVYDKNTSEDGLVSIKLKGLLDCLKNWKNKAIAFTIINKSVLRIFLPNIEEHEEVVQPDDEDKKSNNPTGTVEIVHETDFVQITPHSKSPSYVEFSLLTNDLLTMVINTCIGNGFIHFTTVSSTKQLRLRSVHSRGEIIVEKTLFIPEVPDFSAVLVTKLMKLVLLAGDEVSETILHVPVAPKAPLRLSAVIENCHLGSTLFDQSIYQQP